MDIVSTAIASVSAIAALFSAGVAWRARGDSRRSSIAATNAEHRATRPQLLIEPEGEIPRDATDIIYRVYSVDGPDLTSVIVHRPANESANPGGVVYPVAATGRGDYTDSVEIGPIPLTQHGRFTLKIGSHEQLPEFWVKITCHAANREPWQIPAKLLTPRGPAQRQAEHEQALREVAKSQAAERETLHLARNVSHQLSGGAGFGADAEWQMTTLRVAIRNDSPFVATNFRLVVGDNDFIWSPESNKPIAPGEQIDVQADLGGSLPHTQRSEASGKKFTSYPSRLEFTLDGRRFTRREDTDPELLNNDSTSGNQN